MPSRKRYHKVRGGCLTCKRRKVRCDLKRPTCRNCNRISLQCTYTDQAHEQDKAQLSPDQSNGQLILVGELELMHHFTAYTCHTLSDNPILASLWKEVVPKHAFQQPFLLKGILAIAAHHKLATEKAATDLASLIDKANRYQQQALSNYIHLLNHVTQDNCHALYAFAQIIVGFSFARLSSGIRNEVLSPHEIIAELANICDLLKGVLAVALEARDWLRTGDLAPMVGDKPEISHEDDPSTIQESCMKALSTLSHHLAHKTANGHNSRFRVQSLLSTVELLKTVLFDETKSVNRLNKVAGLPVFFDPYYIKLLKSHDHAALTTLAYYGIALHQAGHVWCFDGVGSRIVQVVAGLVSSEWLTFLDWPRMILSTTSPQAKCTQITYSSIRPP